MEKAVLTFLLLGGGREGPQVNWEARKQERVDSGREWEVKASGCREAKERNTVSALWRNTPRKGDVKDYRDEEEGDRDISRELLAV